MGRWSLALYVCSPECQAVRQSGTPARATHIQDMDEQQHHRTISARELGRRVADVLDSVELERQTLLVTRNGRPVATLTPLSSRPRDGGSPFVVVLTPLDEKILLRVAERAPQLTTFFDDLGDWREIGHAEGHLELEGLLERDFVGYRITEQGALVAALLQARANA